LIVAVNTDPKAPIFGAAHYGAVTDVVELIPMLTEEARKQGLKKAS
jgi:electron transfer flavoprotein alpha subunit